MGGPSLTAPIRCQIHLNLHVISRISAEKLHRRAEGSWMAAKFAKMSPETDREKEREEWLLASAWLADMPESATVSTTCSELRALCTARLQQNVHKFISTLLGLPFRGLT